FVDSDNALAPFGQRYFPSLPDALVLQDAYGYQITPIPAFLGLPASLVPGALPKVSPVVTSEGVLAVPGDATLFNDTITLALGADGTSVVVNLDGVTSTFARSAVRSIVVNAGVGNDTV